MTTQSPSLATLDWDDVRLFLQVARSGSLAQAARQVRLDQSTLSRRLSRLEACLGGALFERRRAGLRPTELAQRLTAQAEAMERAVLALAENAGGDAAGLSGSVRIAMMEGIGTSLVARHLLDLRQRHPDLRVEPVTSASMVNVSRREADVFLSFFRPEGAGLECEQAGSFALYLYASREYLAARGTPPTPEALRGHAFVGYIDDLVQLNAVRWLDEVIADPPLAFASNSMLAQMTAAASGLGIVLLPRFAAAHQPELVPVLADRVRVVRELWLSVHHDLQYSRRIRAVTSTVRNLLRSRQAWLNGPPD